MASRETLDEIRNRVSIVSLVGERVALKKSGRNHKGLCPFHGEKTPSFMVNEERQMYHCFGCHEGGDIFSFLMKMDSLTFPEALQDLARRANVTLPEEKRGSAASADAEWVRRKKWAFRLNTLTKDFFVETLNHPERGKRGRDYLRQRGVTEETAREFCLGFSPPEWEGLAGHLKKAQAPLGLARELGLIKARDSATGDFDFFRDRLMFPILNPKGEILGFGGRTLEKTETAKYLNSADSFLYHKSERVYGLHLAREAIRQTDEIVLVEGYMDVIALRQSGEKNAVAPLGTALTPEQIALLTRYSRNFVLAFDGDAAGKAAALRTLPFFIRLGMTPKALSLPEGSDPDLWIRENGLEAWKHLKANAPTLFEYFIDQEAKKGGRSSADRLQVFERIREFLVQLQNPVEKELYARRAADRLRLDETTIRKVISRGRVPPPQPSPSKGADAAPYPPGEKLLLAALVLKPELAETIRQSPGIFIHEKSVQISTQLFEAPADESPVERLKRLETIDPALAAWVREIAILEEGEGMWEQTVRDCLKTAEAKKIRERMGSVNRGIREAEEKGEEKTLLQLLGEKARLSAALKG